MKTRLLYGACVGLLFFVAAAIDDNLRSMILWRILKAPVYTPTPDMWCARVLSDIATGFVGFVLGFVIAWSEQWRDGLKNGGGEDE
jgi:hypothetical protein